MGSSLDRHYALAGRRSTETQAQERLSPEAAGDAALTPAPQRSGHSVELVNDMLAWFQRMELPAGDNRALRSCLGCIARIGRNSPTQAPGWYGQETADEQVANQESRNPPTISPGDAEAFVHSVAHDLREPLRTIGAFTELLVRRAQLDEEGTRIAEFIVDGVNRMTTLLDDLLAAATAGNVRPESEVDLATAAADAVEDLGVTIARSGALVTMDSLPVVRGSKSNMTRLFQNIISNAIKYRSDSALRVHISAERRTLDWLVRITDNGIGIAPEDHRRIFDLFTRLQPEAVPGSGIGLAVCRKIVNGFGGAIWVESEPGAGATFCFTIPVELAS